ncbi:MAG: cytochrome P450 [Nannocystis sp.]|uniref:cytochrome P450 n=1 Tax=Nannocystis sp. TaxID=1962667 RepID=UPI0024286241|nr:cytochrome P450 [Nannocystis sp.]MBK9755792.1 cytochrome P450 [Nannocystis sp.]
MSREVPLAPQHLPVLGHAARLLTAATWDAMEVWLREHGPTLRFKISGATYIVSADPEVVRHVLLGNADNYAKDIRSMAPFLDLLGDGLLTSDGPLWRRQRATLARAFRIDSLRNLADVTRRAVDRSSESLTEHAQRGAVVDVGTLFRRLTLQVIAEAALSMTPEESDDVLPRLYEPLVAEANRRVWLPARAHLPIPARFQYDRSLRELNLYLRARIDARWRQRQAEPGRPALDMLDMLLVSVEHELWTEDTATLVSDELKTMLFAGHETTSAMLTWTLHALMRHPECLARLRDAADEIFVGAGMPEYEALKRLDYAGACLKEALRIYNVVPIVNRKTLADDHFADYHVPAGCFVMLHLQALHRDPQQWPEPEAFRPERFLGESQAQAWRWLPFLNGPRSCVGQHFALLEAKIVLSLLTQRFDFTPGPGNSDARHRFNVPVGPAGKIGVRVHRRV